MPRACLPIARTAFAAASLLVLSLSGACAADIECSKIGSAYDNLFSDANSRVQSILAEFKALPAGATEERKDAIRKRFCAVGGELVGFYKFVQALGKDCSSAGENMAELMDIVNKQLSLAQQGVHQACE